MRQNTYRNSIRPERGVCALFGASARPFRLTGLGAALFIYMAHAASPAAAMQILGATDHAELTAEISATSVNRVALAGDRISRVIRAPGGFTVEHDAKRGDLYLRPLSANDGGQPGYPGQSPVFGTTAAPETVTLFLGTEKGFTYRLSLAVTARDSAQILIRNPDAAALPKNDAISGSDPQVGALTRLIRSVARREPLAGYTIEAAAARGQQSAGLTATTQTVTAIETWRGPRFTAEVVEVAASAPGDAAELASLFAPGVAAAWLSAPGSGPSGGRLAVVVREHGKTGDTR